MEETSCCNRASSYLLLYIFTSGEQRWRVEGLKSLWKRRERCRECSSRTDPIIPEKKKSNVPDLCFKHGVGSDRPSHQSVRHPQSIPVRFLFLHFKWLAWESHWTLSWSLEQGISLLKRESFGQFPLVPP